MIQPSRPSKGTTYELYIRNYNIQQTLAGLTNNVIEYNNFNIELLGAIQLLLGIMDQ